VEYPRLFRNDRYIRIYKFRSCKIQIVEPPLHPSFVLVSYLSLEIFPSSTEKILVIKVGHELLLNMIYWIDAMIIIRWRGIVIPCIRIDV
jgi:hypothetical protein